MTSRKRRPERAGLHDSSATIVAWLVLFSGLFVFARAVYLSVASPDPLPGGVQQAAELSIASEPTPASPTRVHDDAAFGVDRKLPSARPNSDVRPGDLLTAVSPVQDRRPVQLTPTTRRPDGRLRVAIIIDDLGNDPGAAERLAQLPHSITFAVIPHLTHSRSVAEMLNARGYELMLHLPMEPVGYPRDDPGPGAILSRMPLEEVRRTVLRDLAAVPHIRGVNNHMGSRITSDPLRMRAVLETLATTSFFFIDSRTIETSVAYEMARELRIPSAERTVFLDSDSSEDAIRRQLSSLADIARRRGHAIAIGHPYPTTIGVLAQELPRLVRSGITIVFASELVS